MYHASEFKSSNVYEPTALLYTLLEQSQEGGGMEQRLLVRASNFSSGQLFTVGCR